MLVFIFLEFSSRRPGSIIGLSELKTNQLMKKEGKRLLIGLLKNNVFSKLNLSLNFKIEYFKNQRTGI